MQASETESGDAVSYQWYFEGNAIFNATASRYVATGAGLQWIEHHQSDCLSRYKIYQKVSVTWSYALGSRFVSSKSSLSRKW
jgi:hypothetical protein